MSHRLPRAVRRARGTRRSDRSNRPSCVSEPLEVRALLSTVTGTVFNDANVDGTLNSGETGLSGLTVTAKDSSNNVVGTGTSDASGNYTISGLPLNEPLTFTTWNPGWVLTNASGSDGGDAVTETLTTDPTTLSLGQFRSLPAPSGLTATAVSGSETDLSWTSNSIGMESGFHVYESVNGGAFNATPVATTSSGITTVAITGLDSANDYVFVVAAFDANGDTYRSNAADAAAPPMPTVTQTAALLDGSSVASITVTWTPAPGTPPNATYDLYRNTTNVMPTTPLVTGLTGTSYTDTSVIAGDTYYYWVLVHPAAAYEYGGGGVGGIGQCETSGSGGGGPGTSVPTTPKTLVYYQWVNPMAGIQWDFDSNNWDNLDDEFSLAQIPAFSPSLGTQLSESIQLVYTDSVLVMVGNTPDSGGNANYDFYWMDTNAGNPQGGHPVDIDGGQWDVGPGDVKFHNQTGVADITPPPDGYVAVHAEVGISGGGYGSMQGALAGFLVTTYTYT